MIAEILQTIASYPFYTDVFLHTNVIFSTDSFPSHPNLSVHLVGHSLTNKDPFLLPWLCRPLMFSQRSSYDIFIYAEDDILIPRGAIEYWRHFQPVLTPLGCNLGFMRIEVDSAGQEFCSDLHNEHCLPQQLSTFLHVDNGEVFAVNTVNTYTAFWIYAKEDFLRFTESPLWPLPEIPPHLLRSSGPVNGYAIREAAAIGMHGIRGRPQVHPHPYSYTVLPLSPQKTLDPRCRVYHLPNTYVNDPNCFFASVAFSEALVWSEADVLNPAIVLQRKRDRIAAAGLFNSSQSIL